MASGCEPNTGARVARSGQDGLARDRDAETFVPRDVNLPLARREGEPRRVEETHETPDTRAPPARNPRGDGSGQARGNLDADGARPLSVETILERFAASAPLRVKKARSRIQYARAFRAFAASSGIDSMSRRQLAGAKVKRTLIGYIAAKTEKSQRWTIAALKSVWILGIGLPWPLGPMDVGKTPRVGRRTTPPDVNVRPWLKAIRDEPNSRIRLIGLLILHFGWRPESQLGKLQWRNLTYRNNKPFAIVADGADMGFKTYSPVWAWLPDEIMKAILAWNRDAPRKGPNDPLIPWMRSRPVGKRATKGRTCKRKTDGSEPLSQTDVLRIFEVLEHKWSLPHLTPVDFRHFVATKCRESGLSRVASARLQGHDPMGAADSTMRDGYDNPDMETVFAEQSMKLPNGAAGLLDRPEVSDTHGLPPEIASVIAAWMAGDVDGSEVMPILTRLKRDLRQRERMTAQLLEP